MARMKPVTPIAEWTKSLTSAHAAQLQIERSRELIRQSRALLDRPVRKPMWASPLRQRPCSDRSQPPDPV